ncbi:MAG: TMEM198/TM7SF3 family protein [Planctomycetes bacterium]|nr:TMEM198/TM7SF3 family protein [Planctomycetota bacterium]
MISALFLAQDETVGSAPELTDASASEMFSGAIDRLNIIFRPDELLESLSHLPLMLAAIVVVVGILCVFNGYRWHKWVVAILAFIIGIGVGLRLSQEMGRSMVVASAVGCLCAIVATPLLRVTVAIFGGLTGAFIGANAWTAIEATPDNVHWAGAIIGFIVVAMASLILFRLVVVLFTSVGGAAMVVLGAITLLINVPRWRDSVESSLQANHLVIPLLMLVAAVSGFVIQESRLRAHGVSIVGDRHASDE